MRFLKTSKASGKEVFSWCLYDFANSAFATTILAVIFNRYYAGVVAGGEAGVDISFLWINANIHGAALFNYIVAIAMAIVALSSPIIGAWADSKSNKKLFLSIYVLVGILSTAMLATIDAGEWLAGAVWFIIADVAFAGGNVFYNAFLREIASDDEMGKVSSWGWGIGYIGGGLLLVLNLIMLQAPGLLGLPDDFFSVKHTFLTVSVWWALFSLPLVLNVREKPIENSQADSGGVIEAIRRLIRTFKQLRSYKQLLLFLVAYLFFNDGIETVIIMASIFGDQELGMGQGLLIGYFLLIQFTAFIGSILFGALSTKIGNKTSLLISLVIWCLVVISAYFIGWSGKPIVEYFILGIFAGMVMGASQAIARGLQATFTPVGHEAEFFGFFAISGKFAAIFGPFIYGLVVMLTGSLRSGILSLIFFFIVGIVILFFVNEEEGRKAALAKK